MPLYIGLPVSCDEAFRIFGINILNVCVEIMDKYHLKREPPETYLIEYLNNYFADKSLDVSIYPTNKGHYVIGYHIETDMYATVNTILTTIIRKQKIFNKNMELLHANLSNVKIINSDGEEIITENPTLYVIEST